MSQEPPRLACAEIRQPKLLVGSHDDVRLAIEIVELESSRRRQWNGHRQPLPEWIGSDRSSEIDLDSMQTRAGELDLPVVAVAHAKRQFSGSFPGAGDPLIVERNWHPDRIGPFQDDGDRGREIGIFDSHAALNLDAF